MPEANPKRSSRLRRMMLLLNSVNFFSKSICVFLAKSWKKDSTFTRKRGKRGKRQRANNKSILVDETRIPSRSLDRRFFFGSIEVLSRYLIVLDCSQSAPDRPMSISLGQMSRPTTRVAYRPFLNSVYISSRDIHGAACALVAIVADSRGPFKNDYSLSSAG